MGPEVVGIIIFVLAVVYAAGVHKGRSAERRRMAGEVDFLKQALRAMSVRYEFSKAASSATRGPGGRTDWKSVLGFPGAFCPTREQINDAYKRKAKTMHPDRGGSAAEMAALNIARQAALREIAA